MTSTTPPTPEQDDELDTIAEGYYRWIIDTVNFGKPGHEQILGTGTAPLLSPSEVRKSLLAWRNAYAERKVVGILAKLKAPYHPTDTTACGNHQKYTSACCGCQRAAAVAHALDEAREIVKATLSPKPEEEI